MSSLDESQSVRLKGREELKALRVAERIDPKIVSLRNNLSAGRKIVVQENIHSERQSFLGQVWHTCTFFLHGRVERKSDVVLTSEGFQRETLVRYISPGLSMRPPDPQLKLLPLKAYHFSGNNMSAADLLNAAKRVKF